MKKKYIKFLNVLGIFAIIGICITLINRDMNERDVTICYNNLIDEKVYYKITSVEDLEVYDNLINGLTEISYNKDLFSVAGNPIIIKERKENYEDSYRILGCNVTKSRYMDGDSEPISKSYYRVDKDYSDELKAIYDKLKG